MEQEMMKICYAPDNNYAVPCAISIQSLMQKTNPNTKVCFRILDGGLSEKNKTIIKQIVDLYKNAQVKFDFVNDEEFKDFYTEGWKTSATYRFKIDSLLKDCDKILYLDCDIIVNKPIEELYNKDLGDNIIGMVADVWFKKQLKRFPEKKQPYFNTGVCLFDLKKFREENISKQLISYYMENQDKIIYPDQDPINVVLDKRILELDYKYNWCWHWEKNEYFEEFGEVLQKDAAIVHYIFNKPWWSTNIHCASNLYFDTIKSIPKKIRKDYKKYHKKMLIGQKIKLYLFGTILFLKKANYFNKIQYSLFGIPFLTIRRNFEQEKYYLFNLFQILKVKNTKNLEKDIHWVVEIGKY